MPPRIVGIRFSYVKTAVNPNDFENIPFYKQRLRNFLQRNLAGSIWLKGAHVEQGAYLLFSENLKDQVQELLSEPLYDGGFFRAVSQLSTMREIAEKYRRKELFCVGCLDVPPLKMGSPITLQENLGPIDFWFEFPLNRIHVKAEGHFEKWHEGEQWVCLLNVQEDHHNPDGSLAYTNHHKQFWLRKSNLPISTKEEAMHV